MITNFKSDVKIRQKFVSKESKNHYLFAAVLTQVDTLIPHIALKLALKVL